MQKLFTRPTLHNVIFNIILDDLLNTQCSVPFLNHWERFYQRQKLFTRPTLHNVIFNIILDDLLITKCSVPILNHWERFYQRQKTYLASYNTCTLDGRPILIKSLLKKCWWRFLLKAGNRPIMNVYIILFNMRGVTIKFFIFLCLFKGFLWPPFEKNFEDISCLVAAHASYMHVVFLTFQWLLGSTIMFPLSNVAILSIIRK